MKIKRFVAPDMRQAMRLVREDQGPDAVILSTRRLDEGIEIIAAVDYDEALVREAARHGAPLPAAEEHPRVTTSEAAAAALTALPPRPAAARPIGHADGIPAVATPISAPPAPATVPRTSAAALARKPRVAAAAAADAPVRAPAGTAPANEPAKPVEDELPMHPLMARAAQDTVRMRAELGSLREMLEQQLSSLAWNDLERRQPLRARVLRELTRLGIEPDVARQLADDLPDHMSAEQARYLPLGMLSRCIAVSDHGRIDRGGVTALVGPTGVGKTTTIAKLAARAVMRHSAAEVALISTDHYRIGAAAQLEHYGRLLGVRVYPAYDAQSLRQVLELLRGCHTVLIDTAGVAGNDPRLAEQLATLADFSGQTASELHACLVLAANAQPQSLEEAVRAYRPLKPQACILTKLDEAPSLGGALSVLIRHRLALDYTTDGQRVPEDIAHADARVLVCRAAKVLKGSHASVADETVLAERFGTAVASA